MTLQEMFDAASVGMLRQGRQSRLEDGSCVYRKDNGDRCAVGYMLPDHVIDELDNTSLLSSSLDALDDVPGCEFLFEATDCECDPPCNGTHVLPIAMVDRLQVVHDSNPPEHWEELLRKTAKDFGLRTDAMDRFLLERSLAEAREPTRAKSDGNLPVLKT